MPRLPKDVAAVVIVGLLVGSLWASGPVAGDGIGSDGGEYEPGATAPMPIDDTQDAEVDIEVDCDRGRAAVAVPSEFRYDVTVAVANLTPTSNRATRSTVGSVEGNETVEFDGEGIVFVFVRSGADGEVVAADAVNCLPDADETTTTPRPDDAEPEIRIDCNESRVEFNASEGTEYVAKLVAVDVSPTRSSTRSATRTLEGNETVSIDEEDALVAAFASTGELGDDRTVSAIRNCSPYGDERISGETTTGDRDDETEP